MVQADSEVGWCDTLLGYCYRWMTPVCVTLRLSTPVSICTPRRSSTVRAGRQTHPEPTHSQWACHWENTPWLKKAQLWLPLHAWCGLMMAHPWAGDENLMNCQEPNSFKWEIDRQELHIGNAGTLGHLFPGGNMMVYLCFSWSCIKMQQPQRYIQIVSRIHLTCTQQLAIFPLYCLVNYKTAETDCTHCFMLHSHYQRNVLFFLAVKDFITSAALGSCLTLISTCLFNQVPKKTSSLLQALARQHWETYAKFIFTK